MLLRNSGAYELKSRLKNGEKVPPHKEAGIEKE
jgi:hypothetical protein